jgi:ligand-binding SRPBCC domain-containing protein
MTEITEVEEQKFFIDKQRKGPYAIWHHEHYFKETEGGVEMIDIVHYKNPLGFIGEIANSLFVKRQLKRIFEYRFQKVEEIFGKWEGQECVMEIN